MLSINQQAPQINAVSIGGDPVDLAALRARGPVLVKFHRFSGCPIAQSQVGDLLQRRPQLREAGIETIVVLHNSVAKVQGVFEEAPGVHIVADREKQIYRAYGARFLWRAMLSVASWGATLRSIARGHLPKPTRFQGGVVGVPADFLVDRSGKIVSLNYGRHYGDSWSADDAVAAVQGAA